MKVPKAEKLPSGSYFIRLRLDGESIPITRATEQECIKEAEYIKAAHRAGKREKTKKESDKTVGDLIDSYISSRGNMRSPSTMKTYDSARRTSFQGAMDLNASSVNWQKFIGEESGRVSPKTVKNSWGLVAAAYRYAKMPVPDVVLPAVAKNEHPVLFYDQLIPFIKEAEGCKEETAILLGLHSLRVSETLGLRYGDIDMKRKVINIRRSAVFNKSGELVVKDTLKTNASYRSIPIIIGRLETLLSGKHQKDEPVVTVTRKMMYDRVNDICDKLGYERIGTHGLRHSFCSLAYHLGMPEKMTMQWGGWSTPAVMSRIYTHISSMDKDKFGDMMEKFYSENANENANVSHET